MAKEPKAVIPPEEIERRIAAKVELVSGLIGTCIETWVGTRIARKKITVGEKPLTAGDLGITQATMAKDVGEILTYLRKDHGRDIVAVLEALQTITTLNEELNVS